jgi:hypothetical protein
MAPIEAKGGTAKELRDWIAGIRKTRDAAERLRLFYVACTRAKEALHLFATRGTKVKGEAEFGHDSLLAAAWPAAEEHFVGQDGRAGKPAEMVEVEREEEGLAFAAVADEDEDEAPPKIYRLPIGFDARSRFVAKQRIAGEEMEALSPPEFERPEGSFAARAFGNAVHGFLELVAKRLAAGVSAELLLGEIAEWAPRIDTVLRGDGLPPSTVKREAQRVLTALKNALGDEAGRWILGAREAAASEYSFTSWGERKNSFRLDRMFIAGACGLQDRHAWAGCRS